MATYNTDFPDKWIMVDVLKPVDVSNIHDPGMKAVVMLAVSLGWNFIQKRTGPALLKSRTGSSRNIPSDTSVRQSVFWSSLANVLAHSEGYLPTPELIDRIIKDAGLSKAHAQVMRSRVQILTDRDPVTLEVIEDEPPPELEAATEISVEPETLTDAELNAGWERVKAREAESAFVPTERVEPTLSIRDGGGNQYVSEVMDTVIRRLVSDGEDQITYRCKVCELEFPTKRGVGSHYGAHVRAGEATATFKNEKPIANTIPDYKPSEPHVFTPKEPEPEEDVRELLEQIDVQQAELKKLRWLVAEVQRIVGDDQLNEARALMRQLQLERDDAIARADRLASDLKSLKELIKDIGVGDE